MEGEPQEYTEETTEAAAPEPEQPPVAEYPVFLKNLPFSVTDAQVQDFFEDCGLSHSFFLFICLI